MLKKWLLIAIIMFAVTLVGATIAQAQGTQPPAATYVGSEKCKMCHSAAYEQWSKTLHSKMIQDPDKSKDKIVLADFSKLSSIVTDTKQLFTDKDVMLTMGWRYRQRYILTDAKTGRLVMGRGQWNIAGQGPSGTDNTWQDATAGEDWLKECAGCHTTGLDVAKAATFTAADYRVGKAAPFAELSIGCEACHGPGSEHLKGPSKDNIPVNKAKAADGQICGACHTRGSSKDSKGETHQYPLGYTPGGDLTKASWAPVQATGKPDDANWWMSGYAKKHRQQYLEWLPSKHATALDDLVKGGGQDACVACHSADAFLAPKDKPVKLADAKFAVTCVACHDSHGDNSKMFDELLRREMYQECTVCHNGGTEGGTKPFKPGVEVHHPMQEMYEGKGALGVEGKPSPHFTAKDGQAVCVSCHMPGIAQSADTGDVATHNWKIAMPGKAEKGMPNACSACHINDKYKAPQMPADTLQKTIDDRQKEIVDKIAALEGRIKNLGDKNTAWVDAKTLAPLNAAPDGLKTAFTNISFVKGDGSKGFHNYQYTKAILNQVDIDLKKLEQPQATRTTVAPTLQPTPIPPTKTPEPTATLIVAASPQVAPGASWITWIALAAVVVVVIAILFMRKPQAS